MSYPIAPLEGVLLPRQALEDGQHADRLIRCARARARRMVDDAQAQAATLRRQAYAEGYSEGMAQALKDLFAHFQAAEQLHADIQRRLLGNFQAELENLLGKTDFVELFFDKWLDEQSADAEKKLTVLLPPSLGHLRDKFATRIRQKDGFTVSVGVATHASFCIEHGEFVHEFDQTRFMDDMYPEVLACLTKLELKEAAARSSTAATARFLQGLENRCAGDRASKQLPDQTVRIAQAENTPALEDEAHASDALVPAPHDERIQSTRATASRAGRTVTGDIAGAAWPAGDQAPGHRRRAADDETAHRSSLATTPVTSTLPAAAKSESDNDWPAVPGDPFVKGEAAKFVDDADDDCGGHDDNSGAGDGAEFGIEFGEEDEYDEPDEPDEVDEADELHEVDGYEGYGSGGDQDDDGADGGDGGDGDDGYARDEDEFVNPTDPGLAAILSRNPDPQSAAPYRHALRSVRRKASGFAGATSAPGGRPSASGRINPPSPLMDHDERIQ